MNKTKEQSISPKTKQLILQAQQNEITEATVYRKIARYIKDPHNKKILLAIADDELKHYSIWRKYTGKDMKIDKKAVFRYSLIIRIF